MKTLETKSLVLLRHQLKALRLPTIGAEAEKVAVQAAADNQDHLSYLLQLCELELLEREKRAAERRLKAARFPTMKTLEGFDFAARPSVNKRLVAELARCEFIDQRENVLLVGNPGPGSHCPPHFGSWSTGHHPHRSARRTHLPAAQDPARQARPARPRRARLRPRLQGRRRAPLRRHLNRLRTHQHDRHHQPPVRVVDRSPRLRTTHRGDPRPAHPPLPHHRDQGRQLPPPRRQDPQPPKAEPRPDAHPDDRPRRVRSAQWMSRAISPQAVRTAPTASKFATILA